MQAWEIVAEARAPDGTPLALARRGDEWVVRAAGRVLMTSRTHGSEEALAALALKRTRGARTVLVGGLGLGYTLRAALDRLPPAGRVTVAELSPVVVAWNAGPLAKLAGRPLRDPRVTVVEEDVGAVIGRARGLYDAILLDVDNGPSPLAHPGNRRLYGPEGIAACQAALRPGGVLGVWSAGADPRFLDRLGRAGLDARAEVVPASGDGGVRHVVFVAAKPAGDPRPPPRGGGRAPPRPRGGRSARRG